MESKAKKRVSEILRFWKRMSLPVNMRWKGYHVGPLFIKEVFGDNRKIRRHRRRLALRRIRKDFVGSGSGTRLSRTLDPKAVAKALDTEIRKQEAREKIMRVARKNGRTALLGATV